MCIIVVQPKGHSFSDAEIIDFYEHNPHGYGVMYVEGDRVVGHKGVPGDAKEAVEWYRQTADGKACVLHYRFATSGLVNTEMAHPFEVSPQLMVVHNGVLPGGNEFESDTFQFVRDTLVPLFGKPGEYEYLDDPEMKEYLEHVVKGSAVVFLDVTGRVHKFGNKGVEHNGCWYSNTYAWSPPWVEKPRWGRVRRTGRPPMSRAPESRTPLRGGKGRSRHEEVLFEEREEDLDLSDFDKWLESDEFEAGVEWSPEDYEDDEKTDPDAPWWEDEEYFKPKGKK